MRFRILGLMAAGLLVACSSGSHTDSSATAMAHRAQPAVHATASAVLTALGRTADQSFAAMPDRGTLAVADSSRKDVKNGAYTFHPVSLSESHALNAVGEGGELVITAPNGQPIRLAYERHVEHSDGNWTWIGRDRDGRDAVITFGEKAVFGTIPNGDEAPLRLNIAAGKAWLIETDRKMIAASNSVGAKPREPDSLRLRTTTGEPLTLGRDAAASAPQSLTTAELAADPPTVDVLIGYTNGFASRLGGASQAQTRLNFLVDVTNQAYLNSQIPGRVRLVYSMQVTYPDATSNEDALYALTGFTCGATSCNATPIPTALQPLHTARNTYGADLVSLVRVFNDPENDSCGIAWLNGSEQQPITVNDENGGMSVVSDSSGTLYTDNGYYCRDETFAHEVGHNMGSAHDIDTADGDDNVLQASEYGAYAYSFGYKTGTTLGNFYTIMAYGDSGQTSYRVFSNPRITTCGGRACGVTGKNDNAQSLTQTMPIVATFRATKVNVQPPNMYMIAKQGASGKSEVHIMRGATQYADFSLHQPTVLERTGVDLRWKFRLAHFNGDNKRDMYAIDRMGASGRTEVRILDGNTNFTSYIGAVLPTAMSRSGTDEMWTFELADHNKDGKQDLYGIKRKGTTNKTEVYVLSGATNFTTWLLQTPTVLSQTGISGRWQFLVHDVNKDNKNDLICINRQGASGKVEVYILTGANNYQSNLYPNAVTPLPQTGTDYTWEFRLGDWNGDGKIDIFAVNKHGPNSKVQVSVLDGSTGFKTLLTQTTVNFGWVGDVNAWNYDFPH